MTGLSLSLLVAACGAAKEPTSTAAPVRTGELRAWAVVEDAPGISQLAPDLHGLDVVDRVDHEALVRNGDAIRSTTITFATPRQAAEAQKRGAGDDYQGDIERAFRGDTVAHGPGVGLRLHVPRPTGSGSDSVELYLLAHGRMLTLVELVSARGFDPALRRRVLSRLSR